MSPSTTHLLMPSSRYRRPAHPAGRMVLTVRDLEILRLVHNHRFVHAEHLHPLIFPGRVLRVVQARLAKLWHHGYLDRHFVPYTLDGQRRPPSEAATPIYALGAQGNLTLAKAVDRPADVLAERAAGSELAPITLAHHLVVTDLLASIEAAVALRPSLGTVETEHEHWLWKKFTRRATKITAVIVPDGVVTFRGAGRPGPETWYVEIVRAGVSGGNDAFRAKMVRYLALREAGTFRETYGHPQVRGVLVATPSAERARNLRALATSLPHGRRFFAFTHYEDRVGERRVKRFRPETVLDLGWTDGAGGVVRLGSPGERAAPAPSPG